MTGRASRAVATRPPMPSPATSSIASSRRGREPKDSMDKKPGPRSRAVFSDDQSAIAPGQQRIALLSELALASGKGATITDLDGNTYLDFFAGVAVASLGHAHPDYVAKV